MPRWFKATLVGITTSLVGVGLVLTPLGATFEQRIGLTWLFNIRGAVEPPGNIAVVAIDGRTGERLALPKLPRDWPRSIHGRVVDRLARLGASTIVFDMDFRQAKSGKGDEAFAHAMRRANRVVLLELLEGLKQPLSDVTSGVERIRGTAPDITTPDGTSSKQTEGWLWVERLVTPAPVLAEAAYGMGAFPVPKTEEAVYQYWVFKPSTGDAPTIPAVALQVHAMSAYEDWRRVLERADVPGAADLPAKGRNIDGAQRLKRIMVDLRRSFQSDPAAAKRLARVIDESDFQDGTTELVRALVTMY